MHVLKGQKLLGRCVISYIQYALKGQKLLAQGNALGILMDIKVRPERAKALDVGSFCPFRAFSLLDS